MSMTPEERAIRCLGCVNIYWAGGEKDPHPFGTVYQRIVDAIRAAENDMAERAAKEAGYYANHSVTAKNIAKAIRSLKHPDPHPTMQTEGQ